MIELILVHEQAVVRNGLKVCLPEAGFELVAECSTVGEAEQAIAAYPDALLVSDTSVLQVEAFYLFSLAMRSVAFTHRDNPTYVARVIAAGGLDYIPATIDRRQMLARFLAAANGQPDPPSNEQFMLVKTDMASQEKIYKQPFRQLTKRECQVLVCLSYGLANADIARVYGITVDTVKEHVQHILRKLDVNDRTHAAVMYVRLIELE